MGSASSGGGGGGGGGEAVWCLGGRSVMYLCSGVVSLFNYRPTLATCTHWGVVMGVVASCPHLKIQVGLGGDDITTTLA